jgi:hypothetical protein
MIAAAVVVKIMSRTNAAAQTDIAVFSKGK